MASPAARLPVDDYFALDAASERKTEYYDGAAIAMAGASPRHNHVVQNLTRLLGNQLAPRGCFVAAADQRVRLATTKAWVYPDVVVSCAPRFEPPRPQTLVNPELVVEVLSRSTEAHDLTAKLAHYRATDSIVELVFVHLRERLVEHHRRVDGSRWLVSLVREGQVELSGTATTLDVDALYAGADALPDDEDAA
ncbi:MAG: Uma2 family endonuclease [Myxococcota bacterium]|nr:Uma2 family endonuclease [Myxococcota bacterium]